MVDKRVYQVWKGSNNFLLSGRLIFGPDVKSFFVTILLVTVPAALFCIFVARHLIHAFSNYNSGIAILVMAVYLTLQVLILLFLTSSRDPGIIPRAPHPPEVEDYDSAASPASWGGGQTPRWRLPRTRDETVNGITVKVKYCDTCMLYRPPRCSHCSVCDNCVERFDHHCPWVGQCIGKRNYRYFFMFVSSATILCIYVFSISTLYIKLLMNGDPQSGSRSVWQAIAKSPASIILMLYSFIAVWFVGGLTLFHLYLIATNQTTYENFRYRYESRVNPHDLGIFRNFVSIFCTPIEPSKNNFRAKVQLDTSQGVMNPLSTAQKDEAIEIATKSSLEPGQAEANDGEARVSTVSDLGMEAKDTFDEALAHAMGRPLPPEVSERTSSHPRRSSWGRRSGNWEMTAEILALSTGKTEDSESASMNASVTTRPSNEVTGS